jgi:hypothetical protein
MRSTSSPRAVSITMPIGGIGGAQAPADREAVLAREHEVEHQQVVAHAAHLAVHRRGIGHVVDRRIPARPGSA